MNLVRAGGPVGVVGELGPHGSHRLGEGAVEVDAQLGLHGLQAHLNEVVGAAEAAAEAQAEAVVSSDETNEAIEEEKNEGSRILPESNESFYSRFSKFVNKNGIDRDTFCRAVHLFLTESELSECFKAVNFSISQDEILGIFRDHNAHRTGYLPMEEFYAKLHCWSDFNRNRDQELR